MVILVVDLELFDLGVGGVGLGVWCGGCGGWWYKKKCISGVGWGGGKDYGDFSCRFRIVCFGEHIFV